MRNARTVSRLIASVLAPLILLSVAFATNRTALADQALLKTHCVSCHGGDAPKAGFKISQLGETATKSNVDFWVSSLDYVKSGEMPPAKDSRLSKTDRQQLVYYLETNLRHYEASAPAKTRSKPRRLNNREFANSVADVLLLEDVGTNQPMANLLGDTLHDGFDTNVDSLGLSEYHLEQYIKAVRIVVDATILSGEKPASQHYEVPFDKIFMSSRNQNSKRDPTRRNKTSVDFLDVRSRAHFGNFKTVPDSGSYRINIRAKAMDRALYDSEKTGIYDGDPIQLRVHLGDRIHTIDLPDDKVMTIKLNEWLAKGTRLEMTYPTDGLRLRGNGNFKFQYAIAGEYILDNDPDLYNKVAAAIKPRKPGGRVLRPTSWHHWTRYWRGPRPRLFRATIEGPLYESWPPKRQVRLLGSNPSVENAAKLLGPIAERAWRRNVRDGELDPIVRLVQSRAASLSKELNDDHHGSIAIEALKEGIVAILVSPSFLVINPEPGNPDEQFATKFSYFLRSSPPTERLRKTAKNGGLNSFAAIRAEVQRHFDENLCDEFLHEFPHAWLQLDRINFMAPDPDRFRLYDRKRLSEDMIAEVMHFFRYMVDDNQPITEFISADYSFVNADLAKVYGLNGVAQDSRLRKFTFTDGRRGGLLGMGAFLTLTADSLGTSPIHRAVYMMENLLGIHPTPPPADVKIEEPDVRQAKTIKEILAAHTSDKSCAACHERIDPYGYAFENFGPMGEWRDSYPSANSTSKPAKADLRKILREDRERAKNGLPPVEKPWQTKSIPVDSSSRFLTGSEYKDIAEFRQLMQTDANRDRFVRCFIVKLLTYANGAEPNNYTEIQKIVQTSAEHDYKIVETIAAVIHSRLFRPADHR